MIAVLAIKRVAKAIAAAVTAGAATVVAVAPGGIDPGEWGKIAGAVVVAGLTTWAIPNSKQAATTDGTRVG